MTPRYLGSWTLPSGNSCDVTLETDGGLTCVWDVPPPAWPAGDLENWRAVVFPAIVAAVADMTGQAVLGVTAG